MGTRIRLFHIERLNSGPYCLLFPTTHPIFAYFHVACITLYIVVHCFVLITMCMEIKNLSIYNESLARGDVPDEWRQANVTPVYKKGEKYDAANYRPVSLTCICCKTLEHILVSNINKHLALDSILADCQHGFRSQRSCETQLVQFVHDIISNLDRAVNRGHKQTDLIIMDFAKAFDKVPHRRLLHKLEYYGIRGSTHK